MSFLRWPLAAALLLAVPAMAATPPSVVLAVDVSRSIRPAELAATVNTLRQVLAAAPGDTGWGLLAFADEPRWLVEPPATAGTVAEALSSLAPTGNHTLLHDALFAATRRLDGGGVVLLVSDGRDENSATTVEDVAARAAAAGVHVVGLAAGRRVEARALRRLALLTDGAYAGEVAAVDAGELAALLGAQLRAVRTASATAQAAGPAGADDLVAAEAADGAAAPASAAGDLPAGSDTPAGAPGAAAARAADETAPTSSGWFSWLSLLALALVAIAAAVLLAVRGRQREPATVFCDGCGAELGPDQTSRDCASCRARDLEKALRGKRFAPAASARQVRADTAVFKVPFEEAIEKTFVMTEQFLLDVKEPGESLRSYLLPRDAAFAVGRDGKVNTLGIGDPTLSTKHFRVVPENGSFYLLDERSTNGTFVNGEKVGMHPLRSGDRIQAGQVEFTFKVQQERLG